MHYGLWLKVLKALVDEVRVAQVPLVKVDLFTKYLLKSLQTLLHRPYGSGAPASNLLDPLSPEVHIRPTDLMTLVGQMHREDPPDVPVNAHNKGFNLYHS